MARNPSAKPGKTYETFVVERFLNRLLEQVGLAFELCNAAGIHLPFCLM